MEQKELIKTFNQLKALLKPYEGKFQPKFDMEGKYDLWSFKDIEIDGRKRKEMYFAGLIIQSKYVGFYYMPVYTDTSLKDVFGTELLNKLKGKSCFHIKQLDEELSDQIKISLEKGYELYKKRNWV